MSRIGRKAVQIPGGVDVAIDGDRITIKGPKGTLEHQTHAGLTVEKEDNKLKVERTRNDKKTRALHGLTRAVLQNHVIGVKDGYEKQLEIHGVSFQAALKGKQLGMKVGYANEIILDIPAGVTVEVPTQTLVTVRGPDKQKVGQFAAEVRASRPPEPYKGKGVRYRGEHITRKQGKSFVGSD